MSTIGEERQLDFRVIILSSAATRTVARLIERLDREVQEARVCAVVYEILQTKSMFQRARLLLKSIRQPGYIDYLGHRILQGICRIMADLGHRVLQIAHACPAQPNGPSQHNLDDLARFCSRRRIPLHVTADIHAASTLNFIHEQSPDLGLVYGTRILRPELFNIPRHGSINIHQRKVPAYRGGGPVGLWELLDTEREIGVTVHRVLREVDVGPVIRSTTIPIEPFDTLVSLALKADVVGNDLLVACVRDFARQMADERPQIGPGRVFRSPKPAELYHYERRLRRARPRYQPELGRPRWKLAARSLLFGPRAVARNWLRRYRKLFPVVILYHHVVTDRPHPMGISTEAFFRHVAYLRRHYRIVRLDEALNMLEHGSVTAPTVVLTFDDGYGDNFVSLRAVVEATEVPITLFVSTSFIASGKLFPYDIERSQLDFLPLTMDQLARLAKMGFEIGSHTRSHFDCGSKDADRLREEIVGSKEDLEQCLHMEIPYFSFPWGHPENMSELAIRLAMRTYRYVFAAYGGENFAGHHPSGYLKRCSHPGHLWELELTLQALLDRQTPSPPRDVLPQTEAAAH